MAFALQPDRSGKKGTRRHILADSRGIPLSIVETGAARHDVSQLEVVLESRRVGPQQNGKKIFVLTRVTRVKHPCKKG